jgi:sugar phosphate isomerase/epimerase
MQIFASTTFHGNERTRVTDVVQTMRELSLDGIELGSTHLYEDEATVLAIRDLWPGRLLTHNFFPPKAEDNFVLNLAAADPRARAKSLDHCRYCIDMAAKLGAELYTVHPGFMAVPLEATANKKGDTHYDFTFSKSRIPHEVAFAASLESLAALMDHAENAGVTLAIETEGSVTKQGVLLMETPQEYERLFDVLPDMKLTFNLAHTALAAKIHGFDVNDFIARYSKRFAAVELSHNDGHSDQHAALVPGSYVLDWVPKLPDVPWIMEFRNSTIADLEQGAELIRASKGNRT